MAGAIVATLQAVVFFFFVFVQNHVASGLTKGAIKG